MRKGKVFFRPTEGLGALTISWTSTPKGDAVEANKGSGVGFFSDTGRLLCVIFAEVQSSQDQKVLEFKKYRVEITVKSGKVSYSIAEISPQSLARKKRAKRRLPA